MIKMVRMKEVSQKVHLSFFAKLLICFTFISIIPVLVFGILSYHFSFNNSMRELEQQSNAIVENSIDNLEHAIEEYIKALSFFCADEEVISILNSKEILKPAQTAVYQKMYILLATRPETVAMHVIKADGTFSVSTAFLPEIYDVEQHYDWGVFRELNKSNDAVIYSNRFTSPIGKAYCMTIAQTIKKGGKIIGYSIIDIPEDVLETILASSKSIQPISYTVIDQNYYLLYNRIFSTNDIFLNSKLRGSLSASKSTKRFYMENPQRLITWGVMPEKTSLTIIASVPVDLVVMNNNYIAGTTVVVVIIAILICILVSPIVVHILTRPLNEIVEVMKKVQQGNTSARVLVRKKDEFGFIASHFNMTLDKLNGLYETNLEKQNRLRLSELKALQAQINPHFLYNTLDSIKWLAKLNGVNDIGIMVSQLGRLLKNSIHNQNDSIQIRDEVALAESYLAIQKIRYGDKFEAEIHVDENIMPCVVPKFIIQPLVENAIIHGIENKIGKAKLMIRGTRKNDLIIFEIIDDGVGINEEKLVTLNQRAEENEESKGSIGITNVDKRIKLYYGEEYGLNIISLENVGTITRITIPFKEGYSVKEKEVGQA
ncbi:MAG: proteinhistidine kinase [Clostridia bacterium]|nr:proteinhistidine kinase [Clostridia bacterium]